MKKVVKFFNWTVSHALSALAFLIFVSLFSSVANAIFGGLTSSDKSSSGNQISATSWNRIIDGVMEMDSRLWNFTFSSGKVWIWIAPAATLDVNGSISGHWPAWEATHGSFTAATGGNTFITGFTNTAGTVEWTGFDPSTGIFQPTVPWRYLFNVLGYSGVSSNWVIWVSKNGASWAWMASSTASGNGNIAAVSYVLYLNWTTDNVKFYVANYSGGSVTLSSQAVTWTKIP